MMKAAYIALIFIVAIVAMVFALQNSALITMSIFGWTLSGSLSLFLIVALAIGFLLGLLALVPSVFRRSLQTRGLNKKIATLEKEKANLGASGNTDNPSLPD